MMDKLFAIAAVACAVLLILFGLQSVRLMSAKADLKDARNELRLAKAVSEANAKIVQEYGVKLDKITANSAQTSKDISKLREENAEVKAYLGGAIPADLRRLLNARNK